MAYAGACIGGAQTAPDPDLLSNHDLNSGEVRAGRHLWMTGSISVKGTLIDKYAFQKNRQLQGRNCTHSAMQIGTTVTCIYPLQAML